MRKIAWFVAIDQVQVGPLLTETIGSLLQLKRVLPTDLAWHEGLGGWARILEREEFAPFLASPAGKTAGPAAPESRLAAPESRPAAVSGASIQGSLAPGEDGAITTYRSSVRRYRRAPIEANLVSDDGRTYRIVNISEGGLLAAASVLPQVCSALVFRLESSSLGGPIQASGWITRHAIAPPFLGFGLEFAEIAPEDRQRIREFIEASAVPPETHRSRSGAST